jgi:hypothetical protein
MGENAAIADDASIDFGLAGKVVLLSGLTLSSYALFGLSPILPAIAAHFSQTPDAGLLTRLLISAAGIMVAVASPIVGYIGRFGWRWAFLTFLFALQHRHAADPLVHRRRRRRAQLRLDALKAVDALGAYWRRTRDGTPFAPERWDSRRPAYMAGPCWANCYWNRSLPARISLLFCRCLVWLVRRSAFTTCDR